MNTSKTISRRNFAAAFLMASAAKAMGDVINPCADTIDYSVDNSGLGGKIIDRMNAQNVGTGKLAIVVGHTSLAPGADGFGAIAQPEYPWNSTLAAMIVDRGKSRGLNVKVFYRDVLGVSGAYKAAMAWGAQALIELHFNSTSKTKDLHRGSLQLCCGSDKTRSMLLCDNVHKHVLLGLNRTPEQNYGIRKRNLRDSFAIPTCLVEPGFGNNADDANLLHARREHLADAYVNGFIDFRKA